jgi:AmpD protein
MTTPLTPVADALWSQGWYRFAAHHASPNFGPRPPLARVDLIVLHSISLPPGQYGGPEVLDFFNNQLDWQAHPYFHQIEDMKVSAHFFIRRNGELWQLVSCEDRAWHAGTSTYRGRNNCNNDSIGIELEGLEGDLFEDAQYECLQSVCAALLQRYPIAHLAGHEHIAPGRKGDPGAGFDWLRLQKDLGLETRYLPLISPPEATVNDRSNDLFER